MLRCYRVACVFSTALLVVARWRSEPQVGPYVRVGHDLGLSSAIRVQADRDVAAEHLVAHVSLVDRHVSGHDVVVRGDGHDDADRVADFRIGGSQHPLVDVRGRRLGAGVVPGVVELVDRGGVVQVGRSRERPLVVHDREAQDRALVVAFDVAAHDVHGPADETTTSLVHAQVTDHAGGYRG